MSDGRYKAVLPSGIIKNPQVIEATTDLFVNDVVILRDNKIEPMYDDKIQIMYGVVAANGQVIGYVNENHSALAQEFSNICGSHTDYLWDTGR